jgi:EAL domain-containing protein (putative c-di-GMP-specific phosphodiesterase class I)
VQADILRAMGCHTVQGFLFTRPMFEDEYLAWTRDSVEAAASVA